MNTFQYDRSAGSPEKREQSQIAKISSHVNRRLMAKLLDFVNRI